MVRNKKYYRKRNKKYKISISKIFICIYCNIYIHIEKKKYDTS